MRAARFFIAVLLTAAMPLHPLVAQSPTESIRMTRAVQGVQLNVLATIRGNALTSTNRPLTDAHIRLRNARTGRIVALATTDQAGLFEFHSVEPGSYIVELVNSNNDVLAASDILNPNGGDTVSAIVKLPYEIPPAGGVLGHMRASALIITATAAAAGLLATTVAGQDVSPRR